MPNRQSAGREAAAADRSGFGNCNYARLGLKGLNSKAHPKRDAGHLLNLFQLLGEIRKVQLRLGNSWRLFMDYIFIQVEGIFYLYIKLKIISLLKGDFN